ncbi:uncharacterized protein [Drosophila bipectinata]|uniref:uncharacterized protein n=1 Tax=Drosophila bipectinata TaxID=42026 RepID=UPI001C8A9A44|nr:uncharacterized protein LOC108126396 [Drosophila bipectinata]
MPSLHKPRRCMHQMLMIYGLIFVSSATTLDQKPNPSPNPCDSIKCPPESEIQCPADSSIRENLDLIKSNAVDLPPEVDHQQLQVFYNNNTEISQADLERCCLAHKCVCKTCYIPDCNPDKDEVVVELVPEDPHTPGQCCGKHECRPAPSCTAETEMKYFWLERCQKCQCVSGTKICHQVCDEESIAEEGAPHSFCESKSLNKFFENGEAWVDNCEMCECVRGEPKCSITLCGTYNCPLERQVKLNGTCCPVCWPEDEPLPNESVTDGSTIEDYKDPESEEVEGDALPPLLPDPETTQHSGDLVASTTTSTSTSTSTTTSTASPSTTAVQPPVPVAPVATICHCAFDAPNVVEVRHQSNCLTYGLIAYSVLITIASLGMGFYIYTQRAKKRSYDPVSMDHSI